MRNKIVTFFIVCFMIVNLMAFTSKQVKANVWDGTISAGFAGGSGTESDPYLIETGAELAFLSKNLSSYNNKYYRLENDIDLSNGIWNPIGRMLGSTTTVYFKGNFNGNGKVIKNITIIEGSSEYNLRSGLFAETQNATIKNLGLENVEIITSSFQGHTGAFIGYARTGTTVEGCFAKGVSVTFNNDNANTRSGGLIGGMASGVSIKNCYVSEVEISCEQATAGGLAANLSSSSDATNCYVNDLKITANTERAAVFAIADLSQATISACYYANANCTDANAVLAEETGGLLEGLGDAFKEDLYNINSGYPLLNWQKEIPDDIYKVNIEESEGADVTINADRTTFTIDGEVYCYEGTEISLIVSAGNGYIINKVKCNDEVLPFAAGLYSFVMPSEDVSIQVICFSQEDINNFITEVRAQQTVNNAEGIEAAFNINYELVNVIAGDLFNDIWLVNRSLLPDFYDVMSKSEVTSSFDSFISQMDSVALLVSIKNETDLARMETLFEKDSVFVQTGGYKTYLLLDDEDKQKIWDMTSDETYESTGKLNDFLSKEAVVRAFAKAGGWERVRHLLTLNQELLGIDFTECDKLKSPEKAYALLQEADFDDYTDIKTAFDNAVSEQSAREAKDKPVSDSVSRSRSGSGSGSVIMAINSKAEADDSKSIFTDLDSVPWAIKSIQSFEKRGFVSGSGNGKFLPDNNITREEFIKLLVLSIGIYVEDAECDFVDVPKYEWYYPYISSAVAAGIINGNENGCFGVGEKITREDMAVIIFRLAVQRGYDAGEEQTVAFNDTPDISLYANEAVICLHKNGIILGDNNRFRPKDYSTRAEAVVIANRALDWLLKY